VLPWPFVPEGNDRHCLELGGSPAAFVEVDVHAKPLAK